MLGLLAARVAGAQRGDSTVTVGHPDSTRLFVVAGYPTSSKSAHYSFIEFQPDSVFYSGVSVLNALRSRVPNSLISQGLWATKLGWRGTAPLIIMDGIPYRPDALQYFNLNGIEYDRLTLFQSRNAITLAGGPSPGGAIVLTSATDKGSLKPTVNFLTSVSSITPTSVGGDLPEQWMFNNTLSYAVDTGDKDGRISINYLSQPSSIGPNYVNVKANMGYRYDKLNLRAILTYSRADQSPAAPFGTSPNAPQMLFAGTLLADYTVNTWLSFSGQLLHNTLNYGNNFESTRTLAGLSTTGQWRVAKQVGVTVSLGWQLQDNYGKYTYVPTTLNSLLSSAELSLRDWLFVTGSLRSENGSLAPSRQTSYSAGASLLINNILRLTSSTVNLIKLRAGSGYNRTTADYLFPMKTIFELQNKFDLRPVQTSEAGLETSLMSNRLQANITYFDFLQDTDPLSSFSNDRFHGSGFDVTVMGQPTKNESWHYSTGINWGNAQLVYEIGSASNSAKQDPTWTMGWVNTITYGKWDFRMLIDWSNGGVGRFSNGQETDLSYSKVREIGVGRSFQLGRVAAMLSLSGRNLILLQSASGKDPDVINPYTRPSQKSITLTCHVRF